MLLTHLYFLLSLDATNFMLHFHFHSIQNTFNFILKCSSWSTDYLWEELRIFCIFIVDLEFKSIKFWEHTLYYSYSFKFVKFYLCCRPYFVVVLLWVHLRGMFTLLLLGGMLSKCQLGSVVQPVVHVIYLPVYIVPICSIKQKKNAEASDRTVCLSISLSCSM